MRFLDTNTCVYYLNGRYRSVRDRLLSIPLGEIMIPSLVKAELLFGAVKSERREENLKKVKAFLAPFAIEPFGDLMTDTYASLRFELEKKGRLIGPNDLLIAAIVVARGGILITHNVHEFNRIPDLRLEDWVEA